MAFSTLFPSIFYPLFQFPSDSVPSCTWRLRRAMRNWINRKPKSFSNDPKIEFTSTEEKSQSISFQLPTKNLAPTKLSNAIIQFIENLNVKLMFTRSTFDIAYILRFATRIECVACASPKVIFNRCCSHRHQTPPSDDDCVAHFNSIY